ncbi:MAG: hypothetical protein U0694_19740 [Anaerolineae bacterium]
MQDQLFVAKIPSDYSTEQVVALFETVGQVTKIYRPTKRETGQPETYAFVTMESPEAAQAALERLDGYQLTAENLPMVVKAVEDRPSNDNLFVAKVPGSFPTEQLRALFDGIGEVRQFHRPVKRSTGAPETFAFVRMASSDLAAEAIKQLDGYTFGEGFQPMVVKMASPRQETAPTEPNTRLYVAPLPAEMTVDELKALFDTVGEVAHVQRALRGKDKKLAKFAFITMASAELAQQAVASLNGYVLSEESEPLTVKLADERPAQPENENKRQRPQDALAAQLADLLGETEKMPKQLIKNIVYKCGLEQARAWYDETMKIEAEGGMMMEKLGRKRTPGGVFFFIAKKAMPQELMIQIFPREAAWHKKKLERKLNQENDGAAAPAAPAEPEAPPFEWNRRVELVHDLFEESGNTSSVKVVVVGRPDSVKINVNQVTLTIKRNFQISHVPRGVPRPPVFPTVTTVYVPLKMWHKVEEALKDPEDRLVVEGFAAVEPGQSGYSVYGTMVTTAVLQRARFAKSDSPQEPN